MRTRATATNRWVQMHSGLIVIAVALVMASVLSWSSYRNRQNSDCQTRYNLAVSKALRERSAYAEQDRQSLVTFVQRISRATTRQASRDALDDYLTTQAQIDVQRRANPIPLLDPGRCGDG